jgi:hypothetical protein
VSAFYNYSLKTLSTQEEVDAAQAECPGVFRPLRIGDTVEVREPKPFLPFDQGSMAESMDLVAWALSPKCCHVSEDHFEHDSIEEIDLHAAD